MTTVAQIRLFCCFVAITGEPAHLRLLPVQQHDVPSARLLEDGSVESLTELQERRAFQCRLMPGRALRSLEEADAFLRDRGLLDAHGGLRVAELVLGVPRGSVQARQPGFRHVASDEMAVVRRAGRARLPGHRDPRQEPARDRRGVHAPPDLPCGDRTHARCGPRLGRSCWTIRRRGTIQHRRRQVRPSGSRAGAEVAAGTAGAVRRDHRALAAGDRRGTPASSELVRWDQAYPGTGGTDANPGQALKDLLAAGVRAEVVAPEPELRRWFPWQWYWTDTLVDDLIRQGRLRRVGDHVMTQARTRQTEGRAARSHPGTPAEVTDGEALKGGRELRMQLGQGQQDHRRGAEAGRCSRRADQHGHRALPRWGPAPGGQLCRAVHARGLAVRPATGSAGGEESDRVLPRSKGACSSGAAAERQPGPLTAAARHTDAGG